MHPWMLRPYVYGIATPLQRIFNMKMSGVRISVEQNYKYIRQYCKSKDFSQNLNVWKAPISVLYKASALMLKFHVCLFGGGQIKNHYNFCASTFWMSTWAVSKFRLFLFLFCPQVRLVLPGYQKIGLWQNHGLGLALLATIIWLG